MYAEAVKEDYKGQLQKIKESGFWKGERIICSPQRVKIAVGGKEAFNFCANNYLGLANSPEIISAAKETLDERGYGKGSVPFICGTQDIDKESERKISEFLGTEDTVLYSSCDAANLGLFEVILGFDDAIISDALNHATIIDAIRLWRMIHKKELPVGWNILRRIIPKRFWNAAQRLLPKKVVFPVNRIFKHSDMECLEKHLKKTQKKRYRLIATDGVFSMDGDVAKLKEICDLAEKYNAMVMIDDSHATGFFGPTGRGTHEYCEVMGRVDILTSTLGKALGGAAGGFTSGKKEIIELLRQKSRPRLFSNALPPVIVGPSIKVLDIISETTDLRDRLEENTAYFRKRITEIGFDIKPGIHPIIPIMFYDDAKGAVEMADRLLDEGIYVIPFSYPVVPKGQARIRVQISAAHQKEDLDFALEKFEKVGKELGIIKSH